jgi:hypothetical protein
VKKDRVIEQSHNGHKELLRQNIGKQLKKIEGIIEDLMADIDVKTLPLKERLDMTVRFVALYQRGIAVDNSLDANRVANYESMAIESVIRRVRAQEEREEFRIIDAESAPYLGIENNLDDWRPDGTSPLATDEDDLDDWRPDGTSSLAMDEDDLDD